MSTSVKGDSPSGKNIIQRFEDDLEQFVTAAFYNEYTSQGLEDGEGGRRDRGTRLGRPGTCEMGLKVGRVWAGDGRKHSFKQRKRMQV